MDERGAWGGFRRSPNTINTYSFHSSRGTRWLGNARAVWRDRKLASAGASRAHSRSALRSWAGAKRRWPRAPLLLVAILSLRTGSLRADYAWFSVMALLAACWLRTQEIVLDIF